MKKSLPVILLFLAHLSFSQNPNIKRAWHWYFGFDVGIEFSSGLALADTTGVIGTSEGCATISDTTGNLLFYTDGRTVWNHLHQIMPNGTGLMGGFSGSSTQAALIIPKPLSSNIYYIFTTDEWPGINGLRYSVIDMNLDSGNGDISSQKNILLFAPCTEKLAAVNHCNDTSVWIMGHEVDNNHFRSFLITPNGIDTNHVISAVGFPMMNNVPYATFGALKFAPDGKKLCTQTDSLARLAQLYDFDASSGIVSNPVTLNVGYNFVYAISFSPDNTKLYTGTMAFGYLYQYDITSNDSLTIIASKTLISHIIGNTYRYMQNGPDGKIYVLHSITSDSSMSIIDSPNNAGVSCNLILYSLNLLKPSNSSALPNFNESYFNQIQDTSCFSTQIFEFQSDFIKTFPNPARDWIVLEGKGIKSIEIFNALGSEIGSYPTTAFALQHKINLGSLSCGIYFLKINMIDEWFVFQKLIVQN